MLVVVSSGCSPTSIEKAYGTYVATYPFGTDTVILNPDGSVVQQIVVTNDSPPAIINGHWRFDSSNGYVTFDVYLSADDGFGKLNSKWRIPHQGSAASLPIEQLFLRTIMGSGAQHPYVKQ